MDLLNCRGPRWLQLSVLALAVGMLVLGVHAFDAPAGDELWPTTSGEERPERPEAGDAAVARLGNTPMEKSGRKYVSPTSQPFAPPGGPAVIVGGDTCASATVVGSLPYSDSGTTCGFADDYDEACPYSGSTSPDVVYSYTAGATGTIDITLCNGSTYDTKLYVYDGSCPGTLVACNDDSCPGFESELTGVPVSAGNTYYIVVDGYGGGCGDYIIDIAVGVTCVVDCDPSKTPEGEQTCGPEYNDAYNGGCNSVPEVFQTINCGDQICGESGTYQVEGSNARDTDWYELVLTTDTNVTWAAEAEFNLAIFIIDGNAGCGGLAIIDSAEADPCTPASLTVECLPPGTYWLWVGPPVFIGIPCGANYNASLTCVDCGGSDCGNGVPDPGEDCDPPDGGCCDETCHFAPPETVCGDQTNIECTDPDTCDGAGNCNPNNAPVGTACGSPGDTSCDNPDTCDGGGSCQDNNEPDGTPCPDDGDPCTKDICIAKNCEHIPGIIETGVDNWLTDDACEGSTSVAFGIDDAPAIPADFFCPGSEPFAGTINLRGPSASFDTLVERLEEMVLEGVGSQDTIATELTGLSLVGCDPIQIQGGACAGAWEVAVGLSQTQAAPLGSLTATLEDANAGTFMSTLNVQPKFTFTEVENPSNQLTFDTGDPNGDGNPVDALNPLQISTVDPVPFLLEPTGRNCFYTFVAGCKLDLFGEPCGNIVCHDNPGGEHLHCVYPKCPKCIGACCYKDVSDPENPWHGLCISGVFPWECPEDDQVQWYKGEDCEKDGGTVECFEHTGACCDGNTGVCEDFIPESKCVTYVDKPYTISAGNIEIPDNDPIGARHEFTVPDHGTIADVNVDVLIGHAWRSDLTVTVEHKETGTSVILASHPDGSSENIGNPETRDKVVFDDEAADPFDGVVGDNPVGSYKPTGALSAFDGEDKFGLWSITVVDNAELFDGTLHQWSLHILNDDEQSEWYKDMLCIDLFPECEQHRGACCDGATGVCTDNVLPGDCTDDKDLWFKGTACADVKCPANEFVDQPARKHSNITCAPTAAPKDAESLADVNFATALHNALASKGWHSLIITFGQCFGGGMIDDIVGTFADAPWPIFMSAAARHDVVGYSTNPTGNGPKRCNGGTSKGLLCNNNANCPPAAQCVNSNDGFCDWAEVYKNAHPGKAGNTNNNPNEATGYDNAKNDPIWNWTNAGGANKKTAQRKMLNNGGSIKVGDGANGSGAQSFHAILFAGNTNGRPDYWNDIVRQHRMLTSSGYAAGDIVVLYGNGTAPNNSAEAQTAVAINGAATRLNLLARIAALNGVMKKNEQLYIYIGDHGSKDRSDDPKNVPAVPNKTPSNTFEFSPLDQDEIDLLDIPENTSGPYIEMNIMPPGRGVLITSNWEVFFNDVPVTSGDGSGDNRLPDAIGGAAVRFLVDPGTIDVSGGINDVWLRNEVTSDDDIHVEIFFAMGDINTIQVDPDVCTTNEDCSDGDECTINECKNPPTGLCVNTYRSRSYADVTPFGSIAPPCTAEDAATIGDGFANMLDVFCIFNGFNAGFPYAPCPCGDISPCAGDNFVNMLDVFAAFNAFNADPACPAPCP